MHNQPVLTFHPLTIDRWDDLERLYGKNGAAGGCWCMWWRLTRQEFDMQKGVGNRSTFKTIVSTGEIPGILAYDGTIPVGWCSVEPRSQFPRLDRSRILKKVDEEPVWSVVCFFIAKDYRNAGLSVRLLRAVIDYVGQQGRLIVEGYPNEPDNEKKPATSLHMGLASAFLEAGFTEVARRSGKRPVMRYRIRS